ncbi:MAG: SUMF1/EgtB/PvdO family nonheme iron enzyme, partial [Pirellulaceae bacterium]
MHASQMMGIAILLFTLGYGSFFTQTVDAQEGPKQGDARRLDLGSNVGMEVVYIPPGEFWMGSSAEEKAWATGIEGGATPGTERESYEGVTPRRMKVPRAFWMGRTEVTVGAFRRFVESTGYVSDAERPGGATQVFDPKWDGYHLTTEVVHPWESVQG